MTKLRTVPKDEDDWVRIRLKAAAAAARDQLPPGWGVTFFAFPHDATGETTTMHYISTAGRSDMIPAIREWLRRQVN